MSFNPNLETDSPDIPVAPIEWSDPEPERVTEDDEAATKHAKNSDQSEGTIN